MKNQLIIALLATISFSCQNKNYLKNEIAAVIGEDTIFVSDIDSITSDIIYSLKRDALNILINEKIFENITNENLGLLANKNDTIFSKNLRDINDSTKSIIKVKKEKIVINYFIKPAYFRHINESAISGHTLNLGKNLNVFILFDYKCAKCRKESVRIFDLVKKYNDINFQFVYFSKYIDECARAVEAASFQDNFLSFHHWMLKEDNAFKKKDDFVELAFEKGLDVNQFIFDINDVSTIETPLKNRDYLLQEGVVSTPSFIVNGKIIQQGNTLEYIHLVIDEEIERLNKQQKIKPSK